MSRWQELDAVLTGSLAMPGESGYEAALPWNRAKVVEPAAVVGALSSDDVVATVQWAARHDVRVAVQRTGHSALDLRDDVVLVETSGLDALEIDGEAGTATFGAGVLWGEVTAAAAPHGLLPVCGSAPNTGAVGFLTGGGVGPMARTLGVGSDRVRELTVVTGDGRLRQASQDPDLSWGLRGGKGTLGIVTSATVELARVPTFFGGAAYFAAADIPAVLRAWQPWAESLPTEGTTSVCILQLPDAPDVPGPLAGTMTVCVRLAWLGDHDAGRRISEQLLAIARPVLGGFEVMPGAAIGAVHQDPVEPMPFVEAGTLLADLPPASVEALIGAAGPDSGSSQVMVELRQLGGRAARTPDGGDAFCGRGAAYNLMLGGVPVPDPAPVAASAAKILAALQPWSTGMCMPNFVVTDDPTQLPRFYDPPTLTRLQQLGDRYDPAGVFRTGQVARA